MPKKYSTPELLIRIDERVKNIFNTISPIKEDIQHINQKMEEIKTIQQEHTFALTTHHKRIKNIENTAIGFNISKLLRFIK